VYQITFHACVAAEMIVYKLGGFVADQKAKLVNANSEEATLHLGYGGMLGGWGSTDDKQPISLHVRFSPKARGKKNNGEPTQQSPVEVTVRPRGRAPKSEVFQSRAKRLVKALRAYFVAD
jgi:hypothetical protein